MPRKASPRPAPRPTPPSRTSAPAPDYVPAKGVDSTADAASVLPDPIIPKF